MIFSQEANLPKNDCHPSTGVGTVLHMMIILLISCRAVSAQQPPATIASPASTQSQPATSVSPADQTSPQFKSQEDAEKHKSPVDQTVGILSRKSIFFPELATTRTPLTSGQKFKLFVDRTVAPSTFVGAAGSAALGQATNNFTGYGQGWDAYGKRLGAAVANSASTNFFGTFLFPSMFHQDPRHFFSNRSGVKRRLAYALTLQVVTRTDDGHRTFNWSRILSLLVSESIANAYLPPEERTATRTFERAGTRFTIGIGTTLLKEYWPDIFRKFGASRGFTGPQDQE
jgi:hypothetical protein